MSQFPAAKFQGFNTPVSPALNSVNPFSPGQIGQTSQNNVIGHSNTPAGAGGSGGVNVFDTLTAQQHQIANQLQQRIGSQGVPGGQLGGNLGSALQNALTANPSASINSTNTADYINKSVATPLLRQYDQNIMPRLKDSYASVGALMGSKRGDAQALALDNLQTTIGAELGKAQLSNQQLSANLQEQQAQRQGGLVNQQQQTALGYNQLGAELTGQSHMALQPTSPSMFGNLWGGVSVNGGGIPGSFGGGLRSSTQFTGDQNPMAAGLGATNAGFLSQDGRNFAGNQGFTPAPVESSPQYNDYSNFLGPLNNYA